MKKWLVQVLIGSDWESYLMTVDEIVELLRTDKHAGFIRAMNVYDVSDGLVRMVNLFNVVGDRDI